MKKIQIAGLTALTILGSLTAPQAQSAVTKPVGYETITLQPNTFNLVGVRLHGEVVHTGTFDAFTGTSLTDTGTSFNLVAATEYILELADGSNFNIVGSDASGATITLPAVVSADQQAYAIRKANTLNSVLGSPPANLAVSNDGTTSGVDKAWVPDGTGGFNTYFYIGTNGFSIPVGWYDFFAPSIPLGDSVVINPASAFYVETAGSTVGTTDLSITGSVKTTPTAFAITAKFNRLGSEYPAGSTLDSSGLAANVTQSSDGTTTGVDAVWVPDGSGGFSTYFYIGTNGFTIPVGWYDFFGPTVPLGATVILPTTFYLEDADGTGGGVLTPPANYSNL